MRKMKRMTAVMLAAFLVLTSGNMELLADQSSTETAQTVQESTSETTPASESTTSAAKSATEATTEQTTTQTTETTSESSEQSSTQTVSSETASSETVSTETPVSTETETQAVSTETTTEQSDSTETTDTKAAAVQTAPLINYVVIETPQVTTSGTETVVLGVGDGSELLTSATLTYTNQSTGAQYSVAASTLTKENAVFTMDYPDESWTGVYQLTSVAYATADTTAQTTFSAMGVTATFGVNTDPNASPDDVLYTDEQIAAMAADATMSVANIDSNGAANAETTIQNAITNAETTTTGTTGTGADVDSTGFSSYVVVLDPGHGGTDPGASGYGVTEKVAALKIAQYAKAELEQYSGIKVYLTRTGDTVFSNDKTKDLQARADYAASVNADLFVSIHLNSGTASAKGACVYYPNSSYNSNAYSTGSNVASEILKQLTALGLASGGTRTWNSQNGSTYPDGSVSDYLGVIRNCKLLGIPAVLVEHAYLSNATDVATYLNSDAKLQKIGVADATAIANYYGLKKGFGFTSIVSSGSTSMTLTWSKVSDATGYQIQRSTNALGDFVTIAHISPNSTTSFLDTGVNNEHGDKTALVTGTTYYYRIRSYTSSTNSAWSSVQSGTTIEAPTINAVKSNNYHEMAIGWTKVSNATGYEVWRSGSATGTYKKIGTVNSGTKLSYKDKNLKPGRLYYYKVKSVAVVNKTTNTAESVPSGGRTALQVTKLKAVGKTSNTIQITWTAVSNANQYRVWRATKADGKYKILSTVDAAVTSCDDTTVKTGKNYYYKVESIVYNGTVKGYSRLGDKYASTRTVTATRITSIQQVSSTQVKLTWKKLNSANGYRIYRSTSPTSGFTRVITIQKGSTYKFTDTNLTPNTTYYYYVVSRNYINKKVGYGTPSATMTITTAAAPVTTAAVSDGVNTININWSASKDALGYVIYRSNSSSRGFKVVAKVKNTQTSYADRNLNLSNTYYYRIEARLPGYKAIGSSGLTRSFGVSLLSSVSISSVSTDASGNVTLSWNQSANADGYELVRSDSADGSYQLIQNISPATVTSYTDSSAKTAVTSYYKIRAYKSTNGMTYYSAYSDVYRASLVQTATLSATSPVSTQINLTWNAVSSASGYELYRSSSSSDHGTLLTSTVLTSYSDSSVNAGTTYYYWIRAYRSVNGVNDYGEFSAALPYNTTQYLIMGSTSVSTAQMVSFFKSSGKNYPSSIYTSKGAADLNTFVTIVSQECAAEGVKAEVIFAQICLETGFLQFGGQVLPEQCNFGGLGATDDGAHGAAFSDVRTGIRAQVQHLKGYATKNPLNNACVDPRYSLLGYRKGTCPAVENLGNGNWATDARYAVKLLANISKMKSF